MNPTRQMLFLLSGAALLTASFAIVPPPAASCGDQAAGADHAAMGCDHAAAATASAGSSSGGTGLRAAIDPKTGELTVPAKPDAAGAAPSASATADIPPAVVQIPAPGAGVMAAVPADRTSRAVATIDDSGKPQVGCSE